MATLENCKLFSNLNSDELKSLQRVTREVNLATGEVIFKEGDDGNGIYVVKTGGVQISTVLGQGDRRAFSRVGPGDVFGEMAVLDNEPRSATASAEEDTTVYFVPRADLLQILEHSPRLAISFFRDISRRLREFNRQYIREVIQSERLALVGRFARSIVHDLKNPLNIIGIAAELAGMDTATPDSRQGAKNRIRKQVERISNMVNEILEFTRGSQTSFVMALTEYPTFVQQMVEEIRPEVELKSVSLEVENEPPAIKIALNPARLSRVFYNLMHNACDAMSDGGKIKLRFFADKEMVTTEIEDTGKGIAPEVIDRLFEAFATYGKAHGTGLGLSICKRIIEDHHGQISARNQPGGGAIFVFTLPIQQAG